MPSVVAMVVKESQGNRGKKIEMIALHMNECGDILLFPDTLMPVVGIYHLHSSSLPSRKRKLDRSPPYPVSEIQESCNLNSFSGWLH